MPLDYRTAIDAALWTALEADATVTATFKAGKRLKETGDGWLRERMLRAPNDFPNLAIEMRGEPTPPTPPRVFGMNSTSYTSATVDAGIPLNQQTALVITARIETDTLPIEAAIDKVLWSKWPKLGLAYVTGFTISTTRADKQISGVRYPQVTKLLTFALRPKLSLLTA